jgi:hypothetical protein
VNQYWLRNSTEERSSQKRGLSIQACALETEKCLSEKLAFAKRQTSFHKVVVEMEQSDLFVKQR